MTENEDWLFLNKLLESTNLVLASPLSVHIESRERIDELFSQIQEDYRKFRESPVEDTVRSRIEKNMDAQFQMALLVLSYYARKNNQTLPPVAPGFSAYSEKELSVYSVLKKLALLDMYSPTELRQKLQSGDPSVESFFKAYPGITHGLNSLVTDEEVRPAIRYYLKKKEKTYHEQFEQAFGSAGGRFIVPVSDAQQQELHFIDRIEFKLNSHRNCLIFSEKNFTVDSIEKETHFVERLKKSVPHHKNTSGNLPKNQYIKAVLTRKSLSLNKRPVIFYAVFASHNEQYAAYGYDTKPVDAKEIIGYLDSALQDAGEKKGYILFCIASPTGFADGMGSSPGDILTRYKSPHLSLCLLDLYNNKKYFNTADPTSVALSKLCDLQTDDEKLQKLQDMLYHEMEHRILVNQSVSLDYCRKFVKDHDGGDAESVKKLFYQYAREHNLKVRETGGSGPVIIK